MVKRLSSPPERVESGELQAKARAAFAAVVEEIHDEHRMLEGKELWEAVVEIFGAVRPSSTFKEPK